MHIFLMLVQKIDIKIDININMLYNFNDIFILMNTLPIINLDDTCNIRSVLQKSGFFYVSMTDSEINIINELYENSIKMFTASNDIKQSYYKGINGIGYAPLAKTTLDASNIETKESFTYIINENEKNELYDIAINILKNKAHIIFQKIIQSLHLNPNDYKYATDNSFNTLSLIHYPNIKSDTTNNIYGISEHTDWGFVTLLSTKSEGLQIMINDEWVNIPNLLNHFIVNIGDMLEIISDGLYKSTKHRVLVKEEKYSIVFFYEPNTNCIIKPHTVSEKYPDIKFGDYVYKKINDTYNV
jgi:isopenicillin N synthase-like dioxygenase